MFKPTLSTIIGEQTKVAIASPSDSVYVAAKRMRDLRVNSVIILTGNKVQGILTSKDILIRVVAQNLSPESTPVEKVMTSNPECATVDTTVLDALHIMHDGEFLHLPVVDKDGSVAACVDVLHITHAAISMVENSSGSGNDATITNTMMQKFWDSALGLEPPDYYDSHSEMSAIMTCDGTEIGKYAYPSLGLGNSFSFKFVDHRGRVHRFNCGTENLSELISIILQRIGIGSDGDQPQLLVRVACSNEVFSAYFFLQYEDDEGDKVLITTDNDLMSATAYARTAGLKVLRLHVQFPRVRSNNKTRESELERSRWTASYKTAILAGAAAVSAGSILLYIKRSTLQHH